MTAERLVDEMAVALCSLLRIEDEAHCILALMEHGFRAAEITAHFDEALALAQMARADGSIRPYDSAEYLTTAAARAEYLTAALETEDPSFILQALGTVARGGKRHA